MRALKSVVIFPVLLWLLISGWNLLAQPKGAKAIFESGEGPAVVSPVTKKPTEVAAAKEKYAGIAYQIMLVAPDGSFKPVTKARTFRSGEKVKLLVRTNRSGYLTIMNIGPTGNRHILFNGYVEAFTFTEVPKNTNLVFAGPPGTEKLIIMLSDNPNPILTEQQSAVEATSPSASALDIDLVNSLESARKVKGAKDIVAEDNLKSLYAVVSPEAGYKPVKSGMKDIMLESSGGFIYSVVPESAIGNGRILTLQICLKHQ